MPKRFKDYIAMPKANMYQSLHTTVFGSSGNLFEIQIRTHEMDQVAENGIASHWSYKEHGSTKADLQNAMEQKLQFFKSVMELKDQPDEELIASVKADLLKDSIYVFTPKGDVIELPKGATPIDFAYRVHSSVGEHMVGALVNDTIVPLDYELKDNDIVKVNTNKNSSGPSREWINMAYSTQTKNKIKSFFNRIDKEEYNKNGLDLLQKELKKRHIAYGEFYTTENTNKLLEIFKVKSLEELYINLGNGKLTPAGVIHAIYGENNTKEEIILKKIDNTTKVETNPKDDILVEGIDQVKINIASCCKPVPQDRIVGYITKGYGITVHRMVCPNVSDLEERILPVSWNEITVKKYPTSIRIRAEKSKNILLDLVAKTSNSDIVVQGVNTITSDDYNFYELTISVPGKDQLVKFIHEIEALPTVIEVERVIK